MFRTNQVNKNFISNVINLLAGIFVGLFYTPYLIRCIGVAAYGVVPLAFIVNQYISVVTTSLTGSLTRFYSVSLQQGKYKEASKYLSSSFLIITFISVFMLPFSVWFITHLDHVFNIPAYLLSSAKWLFSFTLIGFVMSLYSSLLNITLYALNRIDLMNIVKIVRSAMKLVLTICFFELINKDVSFIGFILFLTELAILCISYLMYRRTVHNNIVVSAKYFNKNALLAVLSMTIFVIVQQIGDTGLYRIDNIVVNKFWSVRESGILGAVSDFGNYVMTAIGVISSLFGPLILIAYSKGEHENVKKMALDSSLYVGLLAALLIGTIIGFCKPILTLWIGPDYVAYFPWMVLKLYVIPFYAAAGVFAFVYRAWNYLKMPAFITLAIGALNLLISIILCKLSGGDEKYIFYMLIISSVFVILQSYVLCSFCFSRLYDFSEKRVLSINFFKIFAVLILSVLTALAYEKLMPVDKLFQLCIAIALVVVVALVLSFLLVLKKEQKEQLLNYGKSFFLSNID
jgi:membrane protein EpsK